MSEHLNDASTVGILLQQLRSIDLTKACVVIIFQGYRGSTAHSITIEQVTQYGNHVILHTRFREQGWGEAGGAAMTDPYHMIAINKDRLQGKSITFDVWKTWHIVASETQFIH